MQGNFGDPSFEFWSKSWAWGITFKEVSISYIPIFGHLDVEYVVRKRIVAKKWAFHLF